jgi:hypothetical protein
MDSKSHMFLMAYTGAEVKTLRHLSSQTGNILKKSFICVKRLHTEFSCIQQLLAQENENLSWQVQKMSIKSNIWFGKELFHSLISQCIVV